MKLSAWRVALRMARRDALRAKGRSALVIAMIAIPVVGVAGADVTYRSSELSVQQSATRQALSFTRFPPTRGPSPRTPR